MVKAGVLPSLEQLIQWVTMCICKHLWNTMENPTSEETRIARRLIFSCYAVLLEMKSFYQEGHQDRSLLFGRFQVIAWGLKEPWTDKRTCQLDVQCEYSICPQHHTFTCHVGFANACVALCIECISLNKLLVLYRQSRIPEHNTKLNAWWQLAAVELRTIVTLPYNLSASSQVALQASIRTFEGPDPKLNVSWM